MDTLLLNSGIFLAAEGLKSQQTGGQMSQTLLMVAIAGLFFYFILWRPEQKRRKAMEKQRNSLKKGDKVTAMGIVGTIHSVKDNTIILNLVEGGKIEILKAAISDVESKPDTKVEVIENPS